MHRFLFFSLALVCLLAGCSAPQASDPAPDASNDLDAYFEEEPAGGASLAYNRQQTAALRPGRPPDLFPGADPCTAP